MLRLLWLIAVMSFCRCFQFFYPTKPHVLQVYLSICGRDVKILSTRKLLKRTAFLKAPLEHYRLMAGFLIYMVMFETGLSELYGHVWSNEVLTIQSNGVQYRLLYLETGLSELNGHVWNSKVLTIQNNGVQNRLLYLKLVCRILSNVSPLLRASSSFGASMAVRVSPTLARSKRTSDWSPTAWRAHAQKFRTRSVRVAQCAMT